MSERLPIYAIENHIVEALRTTRRLVLQAPTGSGKSTQVPQMLLRHGLLGTGQVVILQPRRLAARLLASRVAHESGTELGREVGYQIRFENVTSAATRIKFETEGILLRRMLQDASLRGIQAIIFDEFHERHLYGDITLTRALDIQETSRGDLLLVVMSATLDAGVLENYLHPCTVVRSEGRTFPVSVEYLPRRVGPAAPPVWELAAEAFSKHVRSEGASGGRKDVLVFMPGGYEINRTLEALRQRPESRGYLLLPLHGELPAADQDLAVAGHGQPKVVVATNVAETSITIEGIRLVIDSGLARVPRYDPHRGINTLLVERISQASADQRTGRAGRTAPGICVRLWSMAEHEERPARELPEVKRLDLAEVVLTLKAAGVDDLRQFRWLETPNETALDHAEELLADLGAIKPPSGASNERPGNGTAVTALGRRMLAFPVHPRYSRMLIAAQEYGCVYEACLVAALTQGRDLLIRNPGKEALAAREEILGEHASSDFEVLIRAWNYASSQRFAIDPLRRLGIHAVTARQVGPLHDQFLLIARQEGLDVREGGRPFASNDEALRKCILIGFSDRVGRRIDDLSLRCELVHGRRGVLAHETGALFVAADIQEIGGRRGEVQTTVSLITAIEMQWLNELFPGDMRSDVRVSFDPIARKVHAEQVLQFRDLVLSSKRMEAPPADAAAGLLAGEVLAGRLHLPKWGHGVDQWIIRLNLLSQWCPELQLPALEEEDRRHILEQLCLGASTYKELKDREVGPVVQSWLSAGQRRLLDTHAPERITLTNGKTPKVTYTPEGPPYIAMRIQELFGVNQTPRIAMGRTPVSVHILAPSQRPVQVTQDLPNFWKEHYPRIKADLQRKYPRHVWL